MSDPSIPMIPDEIKAMIDEQNARFNAAQLHGRSLPPPPPLPISQGRPGASQVAEVQRQIRASLGLPPLPEAKPTLPVEGHVCEFPLWAFSKKRSLITELHIRYDDGSFLAIDAPRGMPGPRFPGYLDAILYHGQHDLFLLDHTSISVYSIFQALGMDPTDGRNYARFRRDIHRAFIMSLATDRFRHPDTGQRSHVLYFRVLWTMALAKTRRDVSVFRFDDLFLASLRSGYLKRLDWEFCLWLDRQQAALARFLYGHILKRIGEKSLYPRNLMGFLRDCGLSYIADLEPKRRNEQLQETVFPALDLLKGHGIRSYELDDRGNIFFLPTD